MDDSIKRGARINELLNSLEEKNGQ